MVMCQYEKDIFIPSTKQEIKERIKKRKEKEDKYVIKEYIRPNMDILKKKIKKISEEENLKKQKKKIIFLS